MNKNPVPILFYVFALLSMLYLFYNLRKLFTVQIGKEEPNKLNFFKQLFTTLSFGVGQKKVYSKKFGYASVMHFMIAWGFLELLFATTVDFFHSRGWFHGYLPEFDTPWFAFINDTGGMFLIAGLTMALLRRHLFKPEHLPQDSLKGRNNFMGDSGILIILIILCIQGYLAEAARLSIFKPETASYSWVGYSISKLLTPSQWLILERPLWWFHAVSSLAFIAIIPMTKMFHIIASLINIGLTNRDKRGLVRPMNISEIMEDPDLDPDTISLGSSKSSDFTWKQLMDSVACTECARCTTVCPATHTGKPLNPMKIITDLRSDLYSNGINSSNTKNLIGGRISETELWSCTTCGACMEECPVLIEHVPTIVDMRRYLVLSEGKPPAQANEGLENMLNKGNPWGFNQSEKLNWATNNDIKLPILADRKEVDVLYWVGCAGSFDPRNQSISRSIVNILNKAGVDYAVLGKEESCTGDSARRLGDEYLFETLAKKNIDTLNKYKFNTVITSCPHCFHVISKEYPDFGGNYNVMHHSDFINDLLNEKTINVKPYLNETITYHDACYLSRHDDIISPPRELLSMTSTNNNIVEMKNNKKNSFCCGAGGGNMWHEINKGSRMNVERFQEAIDTGAKTVATACSFCVIMMEDGMKVKGMENQMEVKDIAELVNEGLE